MSIEVTIFPDRKSGKEIEDEHISRILLYIRDRIDDIPDSLAHLLSIDREVPCDEELMWSLVSCTPKHSWPVDRMKSYDVFPDDMEISRPPLLLLSLADCEVVEKGIIPDIRHLIRIKWKWDTEFIGLSRY